MTEQARAFLDQLDALCLQNDETSQQVMAVLTALRSQDGGTSHLKNITTIAIRRAALPRCAAQAVATQFRPAVGRNGSAMSLKLSDPGDEGRVDLRGLDLGWRSRSTPRHDADMHFASHAREAAQALGLREVL